MRSRNPSRAGVRWCCDIFKGWFEMAGERGIAILVDREADGVPAFIIQSRSVDADDAGPTDHPRPFSLATELQIQFCPWCGHRLRDVYADAVDFMARPDLRLPEPRAEEKS